MSINRRETPFFVLAMTLFAAVALTDCGSSSSPTGPSTMTVSSVTLTAASVAAGSTELGTISLTAAAPAGGASVALSSSNPAVAAVQTPIAVPAGAVSAPFTVTAVSTGTATITASLNGGSRQSPTLSVTAGSLLLSAISLSASSVVGGDSVTGTATLNAVAPPGGVSVALSSVDPATVPATVTVPAGSASATFTITTRAVSASTTSTISGFYGGATASAVLAVTHPTVATASFGVTGPTETETCAMGDSGNTLECTFNGSTSTAPGNITAWDWTYGLAATFAQTTTGAQLTNPSVNCNLMPPPPLPAGEPWFTMTVTLTIHDDLGNVSTKTVDNGVRLMPQGVCGF